ncbi:MAG: 50S ribosomal protein L11 [Candidatus Aenigmarchaeota archaeon]|nr:50S ribosomal protein L11 [Candidatus Aenigmarchaeota archaeon]MDW8149696.1 50S ribosomal protein L11 [Candidatus Aenigmarchaeota archaeon]
MEEDKEEIEILIEGGKASPGPTTAPKFSALKLNVGEIFNKINQLTKDYEGMQVPVKIIVDKKTKQYEIEIGVPPTSSLIKKEAKIDIAKVDDKNKVLASISLEQIKKVAKIKFPHLPLEKATILVLATAQSINGLRVENKFPKEIIREIKEGKIRI